MNTFSGMQIGKCSSDIDCKREAKAPGEGLVFIVYIHSEVAWQVFFRKVRQQDILYSPFSIYSDMMNIRPSGCGARERPRYKTTFGCRASLSLQVSDG